MSAMDEFIRSKVESTYSNIWWIKGGCLLIIDEFIASEESHCVWVVLECLNKAKDVGKVINVVCTSRIFAINGHKWSIHIKYHIDTSCEEDTCAFVVVHVRIEVVHADGIDLSYCQQKYLGVGMGPLTPSNCSNAASRMQTVPLLKTSELEVGSKPDDPPGW
jgi:hypothetical protein